LRTTVELDDSLIEEARRLLGEKALRAMIEDSLREAIRTRRREALRRAIRAGTVNLALSDEDLRRMRRDRQQ
jgi:hypothetical protein